MNSKMQNKGGISKLKAGGVMYEEVEKAEIMKSFLKVFRGQ